MTELDCHPKFGDKSAVDRYTESAVRWLAPYVSDRQEIARRGAAPNTAEKYLAPLELVDSTHERNWISSLTTKLCAERKLSESAGDELASAVSREYLVGGRKAVDAFLDAVNEGLKESGMAIELKESGGLAAAVEETINNGCLGKAAFTAILSLTGKSSRSNRIVVVMDQ